MVDSRKVEQAAFAELLESRVEACRAKDIDRLMSLYSSDIVYYDIVLPHKFVGADAVRENFLRWFAEYEGDIGLETHDQAITVNGDVGFAYMLHADSGTRRGGQDMTVWLRSTVAARLVDDRWQITHEHVSFPINPEDWSAVVDSPPTLDPVDGS